MAHPDILADPTHHLKLMLEGQHFVTDAVALGMLHRHILAGGALPAQWRGEGTAVGHLAGNAKHSELALAHWRQQMLHAAEVFQDHINDPRRCIRDAGGAV